MTEIWVREIDSARERRIFTAPSGSFITSLGWSHDNRHIGFVQRHRTIDERVRLHVIDRRSGSISSILAEEGLTTFAWTSGGTIIFNRAEPPPNEYSENLWEVPVTAHGRLLAKPRRLTNLFGFQFGFLRTSRDGSAISYIRWRQQSDILTAGITADGRITPPRRMTQSERVDWPGSWTHDGRSLLFFSDRNGSLDIFRQERDSAVARPLVSGPSEKRHPQLTADGRWLLYLSWDLPAEDRRPRHGWMMRAARSGGTPERLFRVSGYPGSANVVVDGRVGLTTNGQPRFRCPVSGERPCVVSEIAGRQMVLSAFDPIRGRTGVVARVSVDPANVTFWDLSADGSRIIVGERLAHGAPLQILHLEGSSVVRRQSVSLEGWNMLQDVAWAPDSQSLYAIAFRSNGTRLLRADLHGRTSVLYSGYLLQRPMVSPDGHSLAFAEITADSQIWVMKR